VSGKEKPDWYAGIIIALIFIIGCTGLVAFIVSVLRGSK